MRSACMAMQQWELCNSLDTSARVTLHEAASGSEIRGSVKDGGANVPVKKDSLCR